jgi:hypothetical protein
MYITGSRCTMGHAVPVRNEPYKRARPQSRRYPEAVSAHEIFHDRAPFSHRRLQSSDALLYNPIIFPAGSVINKQFPRFCGTMGGKP